MNNREQERELELCAPDPQDDGDGYYNQDDSDDCFHCGGDGYVECPHPLECTRPHLGGSYGGDGEVCPCGSCGGSGLAKDMTIW